MKINPINNINNQAFGAKIKYNKTMQKGFELAKSTADSGRKKDLDFSKNFVDNIKTILESSSTDTVSFEAKAPLGIFTEIENGQKIVLKDYIPNEGGKCALAINKYASMLDNKQNTKTPLDVIKSKLEDAISLVDDLKDQYRNALKQELDSLENQIKKSNT